MTMEMKKIRTDIAKVIPFHLQHDGWSWKMEYCEKRRLPPAQKWAWDRATVAWEAYVKEKENEE
jgi:hypothetical protein